MFKCAKSSKAAGLSMIPTILMAVFAANQSGHSKAATPVAEAAPVAVTSPATNRDATTSPRSFSVEVIGKGRPVILIPGLMSAPLVWQSTVDGLKADHQLHLIHIAGFAGKAAFSRGNQQPQQQSLLQSVQQELLAYIDAKQLQQPVLIGHSLGGFLAFAVASKAPAKIGPIVSVDGLPYLAPVFTRDPATVPAQMQATGNTNQYAIWWHDTGTAEPGDSARPVYSGDQPGSAATSVGDGRPIRSGFCRPDDGGTADH